MTLLGDTGDETNLLLTQDAGRHRHALSGVDQDAVTRGEKQLHRISVDHDDVQVLGPRAELVADDGIREQPGLIRLFAS